ncbi:MAG TPA: hypothetical protein PLH02_04785 [Bacillota bacterium]|nr:hypothetical protein [Bacillota bacterium]HPF42568.1 hypothetical protein [Bacillota bacterium]HPQ62164.1 hypothetical protein [Bacillota bacterium]HRX91572.1 hypothetical protein [Candidatus Izemoplasmatales bacterium]
MKNLVRIFLAALVVMAFIGLGKAYMVQKAHVDNNQIVLVDFEDSGEPEYIAR